MPIETSPQIRDGTLNYVIGVAQQLKEHGASPKTIDNALKETNIPKDLQKTVEILFGIKPVEYNNKPVPLQRSLVKYQQQPVYP